MRLYRSETNYRHGPGTTAADVVRYEQDELGNDLGVGPYTLAFLDTAPASRLVWFCKCRADAERYGKEVKAYDVSGCILAEDGDGGVLVLVTKGRDKMAWTREDAARMDTACKEAEAEFLGTIDSASAQAVAVWWAKWYRLAGHKRLGRLLVRYVTVGLEESEGET